MPLIECPDCGKQVSAAAVSCPNCGRPICEASSNVLVCPNCGSERVWKVRGLQGIKEELLTAAIFLGCPVVGVIYYFWVQKVPYCIDCNRRVFDRLL